MNKMYTFVGDEDTGFGQTHRRPRITHEEIPQLPNEFMGMNKMYTFVGDDVYDGPDLAIRRNVVKRATEICGEYQSEVFTPEHALQYICCRYSCDIDADYDTFFIIDGSDRTRVPSCIVVAPWATGRKDQVYVMAGGNTLDTDFKAWVAEQEAYLEELQASRDGLPQDDPRAAHLIAATCECYLFHVESCDALALLRRGGGGGKRGKRSKKKGKRGRKRH